jgi:CBS domain-containing protein
MTKRVLTVAPDETINMALMLMADNKVSRIVVTRNHKPLGIITGRDLLPVSGLFGTRMYGSSYWTTTTTPKEKEPIFKRKEQMFIPFGIKAIFLARDVMRHDPIVIRKNSDLAEAARIMIRNRISGIQLLIYIAI